MAATVNSSLCGDDCCSFEPISAEKSKPKVRSNLASADAASPDDEDDHTAAGRMLAAMILR